MFGVSGGKVSGFEFLFSLFGLLLGLALAEGLGGLSRAIRASHRVRIGWATALLGIFVSCDVVTFWIYGWTMRELLPLTWPVLFGGFVVTGTYYVAATLIFEGARTFSAAEWDGSSERRRIARWQRAAIAMRDGGYRALLGS